MIKLYSAFVNPMSEGGGLIAPAVWKLSSSSVSFDFCETKGSKKSREYNEFGTKGGDGGMGAKIERNP